MTEGYLAIRRRPRKNVPVSLFGLARSRHLPKVQDRLQLVMAKLGQTMPARRGQGRGRGEGEERWTCGGNRYGWWAGEGGREGGRWGLEDVEKICKAAMILWL